MRKILCRKWAQSTDPLISLLNSLRKCHGSVLGGHFRHNILRTFLAHHANHLGPISWTMGPDFAPAFDTIFCAHVWYIRPTIWAQFHGPNGHPFLDPNICKCLDSRILSPAPSTALSLFLIPPSTTAECIKHRKRLEISLPIMPGT